MDIIAVLAREMGLAEPRVEKTVELLDEGNTVPFIARYRKEVTGSMDDQTLRRLEERLGYLRSLEEKRCEIYAHIDEQGKMTPEIAAALDAALTLTELDDIYRPYRPKRRTRASVARERGLEDLAAVLLIQDADTDPEKEAERFVAPEREVDDIEAALAGACDIIAEEISDDPNYRKDIRDITREYGMLTVRAADDDPGVYAMYAEYGEKLSSVPPHRILAINRGEKEEKLRVAIDLAEELPLNYLVTRVISPTPSASRKYVMRALIDGYRRLIEPSIERELRSDSFDAASESAIGTFSLNLRQLLMQPPIRGKVALGFDPGYRTGCKLAVVDETGKLLDTTVIYPTKPQEKIEESKKVVKKLIRDYGITAIAIGNGTAGRESERFIADTLREIPQDCKYMIVSEAGASVYSASELGAEEFPDLDVTERSAVSIARRMQDPLSELTKIDPRSIGVGQYQHDMKSARLGEALSGVVEDCVNAVGVDLNTASWTLLSHVAGLGEASAKNIVKYREANGAFSSRAEILKVPRLGARSYQQCAGFLRVSDSAEVLDNTGVHPESYEAAKKLLTLCRVGEDDLRAGRTAAITAYIEKRGEEDAAEELGIGVPTLRDIVSELVKPGRDVRDELPAPVLRSDVMELDDLKPGMVLSGTVRNIVDFGAFVDIGVHDDGLVHISQIAGKYIKHPAEVLAVGDVIKVRVLDIDRVKGRISLSMKLEASA